MTKRILTTLLDNDLYNFLMGQVIWTYYRGVQVTYRYTNRTTSVRLGEIVDLNNLRAEVAAARQLRLTAGELDYLRSLGIFNPDYIDWLADYRLPEVHLGVTADGQPNITYTGDWAEVVFWETPMLAIVSELAMRAQSAGREDEIRVEAERRLEGKIAKLSNHPRVRFTEFGTRRRYSRAWQKHVVQRFAEAIPAQLLGTSNVALAREFGLRPLGTMAHQMFMVTTALAHARGEAEPIKESQNEVLDHYEAEFGHIDGGRLLVFLPDTYGTSTALKLMTRERAQRWVGMRQDSGVTAEILQLMIDFYRGYGIDPQTKSLMPSDGLDVDPMIELEDIFDGITKTPFGWGTGATNDTPIATTSSVIKPIEANGYACGKLTDNRAKAFGTPEVIARLTEEADYHNSYSLAQTV